MHWRSGSAIAAGERPAARSAEIWRIRARHAAPACRHLFLVNPAAGAGDRTEEIRRRVCSLGLQEPWMLYVTKGPGDATRAVRRAAQRMRGLLRIYCCGGDGTLSEVVAACAGRRNCAVGVVPIGSGNDFVKSFPLPKQAFLDLHAMTLAQVREIDLLVAAGRPCVNVVSAGYDAAVAKRMQKYKRLPFGHGSAAYGLAVLECLVAHMRHRFCVEADGARLPDQAATLLLVAANGQYYGGGFRAAPAAALDDGRIDLVRIRGVSRLTFLRLVRLFRQGKHLQWKQLVEHRRCRRVRIRAEGPVDLNVDGEILTAKDPEIRIWPRGLRILLPEGTAAKNSCQTGENRV